MEFAAIITMILVLLALCGVLGYLVWDYLQFKEDVKKDVTTSTQNVTKEKTERLSSIKYVVDQVNTVNTDIYNSMTSNIGNIKTRIDTVEGNNNALVQGIESVFSMNVNGVSRDITDIPAGVRPNLDLIANVTALSGMNIRQLSSNVSTQFCNGTRCIKFPDSQGDTYITGLYTNSKIMLDGETWINGKASIANQSTLLADISAIGTNDTLVRSQRNMMFQSVNGNIGIGRTPINPPQAMLHINAASNTTTDALRVTSGNQTPMRITSGGTTLFSGELVVQGGTSVHNPGNWPTHFNFSGDRKNYIRGDTEMRGNTNNIGNLSVGGGLNIQGNTSNIGNMFVNGNLCVGSECLSRDDLRRLKQASLAPQPTAQAPTTQPTAQATTTPLISAI